jgi:hypothetical protein
MKTYSIKKYGIVIEVGDNKFGKLIESKLSEELIDDTEDASIQEQSKAQADALESLVLAHACSGIDVSSDAYVEGLDTCLEAIANS